MVWVWVFLGIAVAGLVMVACYAVWLAHLAANVFSELAVLGDRAGALLELVATVGADEPEPEPARAAAHSRAVGAPSRRRST